MSYLEQGGSRKFIEPVIKHFGTKPLAKIDQAAIEAGSLKVYPDVRPSTRNRQFFTPTSPSSTTARCGAMRDADHQATEIARGRIRWLTPDEADRFIEAAADHLRPLIIHVLHGSPCGEALWLDWRDVNLAKAHVTFGKTKNGEARGVPLHPASSSRLPISSTGQARYSAAQMARLRETEEHGRHVGRDADQDGVQGRLPESRDRGLSSLTTAATRGRHGTTRPTATSVPS